MNELFSNYLTSPTLENFMSLRSVVMAADGFNPYSSELNDNKHLLESEEHEKILELITEVIWPNHLLSPLAHFHMAHAYLKLGKEHEAEMEGLIYECLIQSIEQTGDGTKENPFLVSRVSDEYDYLREHRLTLTGQSLIKHDGHEFDIVSTQEQGDIWFDVTEIRQIYDNFFYKGMSEDGLASLNDLYWPDISINWSKSWWHLNNEQELRLGVQKELNAEIGPKHPLWGLKPVVFAKSNNDDDVLVHLNDGRFAVVHLVWHGHIDQKPDIFPETGFISNEEELQNIISND